MELKNLIFEQAPISIATINRPTALNALNREVLEDLTRVIREVRHDASVRVLILTGAGDRAFVAGADIAAMAEMSTAEGLDFSHLGHRVLASLEDLPIPVIAAVNGFALGGGTELALARELIMTGDMIDAKTALALGLANQVVAPEELMNAARALAEKLSSKSAFALRQAKAALRASCTMNEDAGLRFEQEAFAVTFSSSDRVE